MASGFGRAISMSYHDWLSPWDWRHPSRVGNLDEHWVDQEAEPVESKSSPAPVDSRAIDGLRAEVRAAINRMNANIDRRPTPTTTDRKSVV